MHRYTHEKCDFIEFECKLLKLTASFFYFLGFQKLKRLSLVILREKNTILPKKYLNIEFSQQCISNQQPNIRRIN